MPKLPLKPTLLSAAFFLLAACSPAPTVLPTQTPTPITTPTPAQVIVVDAYVLDPNPSQDDTVVVIGHFIRDGLYLNGMMMSATWPDEDQPRGVPNCFEQMTYARGVCAIKASKYAVGETVPIKISYTYQGKTYSAETRFTVK